MPAMRQYAALFLAAALMVETRVNVWAIVAGSVCVRGQRDYLLLAT